MGGVGGVCGGEVGPMKAWRIVWKGMPQEAGIYIAPTRGKAMAKAMRQIDECGYSAKWPDLHCRRAPQYDDWAGRQNEYRIAHGMTEYWVEKEVSGSTA